VSASPTLTSALVDVNMFWHGPALSRLEQLCISSFVHHGHRVLLHVYEEPGGVPPGVTLCDAQAIIPREQVFIHASTGSLAPFSDWFRYRLLHERGGLWADTDMVCLRPFIHPETMIFGWQDESTINNAVLGLPPRHALAAVMIERCESPNRALPGDSWKIRRRKLQRRLLGHSAANAAWGNSGPRGLTQAINEQNHTAAAVPFWHFYPISYANWHTVFDSSLRDNPGLTAGSHGLHLWNEMSRRSPGFDKNGRFPPDSLFEQLCRRYL